MKRFGLLLAICLSAGSAFAQTPPPSPYTLTVPLRLENAPEVNRARIYCIVSRLDVGASGAATAINVIAEGTVNVDITGGRHNGDVSVPTTLRVASPAGARSYACNLELIGRTPSGGTSSMTSGTAYTRMTGREVTRAVMRAQGTITP